MTKLQESRFEFDTHTVVFAVAASEVLVFDEDSLLIGTIPNQPRSWGGPRLKPRVSDAMAAIKEVVLPKPKLVTSDERKRKKAKCEPRLTLLRLDDDEYESHVLHS